MDELEPIAPVMIERQEYGIAPAGEPVHEVGTRKPESAAVERAHESVTNRIAVTDRAPQLAPTAYMEKVTYSLYSTTPDSNVVKTSDMAKFSEAPELLEQEKETALIPEEQEMDERILHLTQIVNQTPEQLFEDPSEPQPEYPVFPALISEIGGIVQIAENEIDANRKPGGSGHEEYFSIYHTEKETKAEKIERKNPERRNIIIDDAASWKGHETKKHFSPESRSQASQNQIASYLPFAGLYPFSKS